MTILKEHQLQKCLKKECHRKFSKKFSAHFCSIAKKFFSKTSYKWHPSFKLRSKYQIFNLERLNFWYQFNFKKKSKGTIFSSFVIFHHVDFENPLTSFSPNELKLCLPIMRFLNHPNPFLPFSHHICIPSRSIFNYCNPINNNRIQKIVQYLQISHILIRSLINYVYYFVVIHDIIVLKSF